MRQNQTGKRQILGLFYSILFITSIFTIASAGQGNPISMDGNWKGSYQTPGPSGSLEIKLTNKENKWSGEVKIEGPGHKIIVKSVQNLKVDGDNLAFMIELVGAEITFSGKLKEGKLLGGLEAVEDGKTVGMGSWEMSRLEK